MLFITVFFSFLFSFIFLSDCTLCGAVLEREVGDLFRCRGSVDFELDLHECMFWYYMLIMPTRSACRMVLRAVECKNRRLR